MPVVQDMRKLARSGRSVAEISRETGVSEPTVRKYVNMKGFSPKAPSKKQAPSILDACKPVVDAWLEGDRRNWRKQRHTAKRTHERLAEEHGFEGSYSTVQRYVKDRKETHRDRRDECLDLEWRPGEMQADFGRADFRAAGARKRLHGLVCGFPFSNVGLAQVLPGETAECVCEGPMAVFRYVGGVPARIVFDNATGVGRRVRDEIRASSPFAAPAEHFGFDCSFCNPSSGWEKGGVENKAGALGRALFVPVPSFGRIGLCSRRPLDERVRRSDGGHYRKGEGRLALFEEDCFALRPLPETPFSAVSYSTRKADKHGDVTLDGRRRCSADPAYGRCGPIVGGGAFEVVIYDMDGTPVAEHPRAYGRKPTESVDPASRLALLCRKPGGWVDGRVRTSLPDDLRERTGAQQAPDRAKTLGLLRDVCEESGRPPAVEAMARVVEAGGGVDRATVGVLAGGIADGRGAVVYDEPVDMGESDAAFAPIGGEHHDPEQG